MGGRNVCASFFAKSGAVRQGAAVGFLLFTQFWYWFPLLHGICLSLNPTAVIGLNKDLKMPRGFCFVSDLSGKSADVPAPKKGITQNSFAYPAATTTKTEVEETVTAKAVLSTAARKRRFERSSSKGGASKAASSSSLKGTAAGMVSTGSKDTKDTKDEKKKEEEAELPAVLTLHNPARVVPGQEQFIVFRTMVPAPGAAKEKEDVEMKDVKTEVVEERVRTVTENGVTKKIVETVTKTKIHHHGSKKHKVEQSTEVKEDVEMKDASGAAGANAGASANAASNTNLVTARYTPLLGRERQSGFLLLTDATPEEAEDLVETMKDIQEKEPAPPEPFTYTIADDEK